MCRRIFVQVERLQNRDLSANPDLFQTLALKNDASPTISPEFGFLILTIILLPDFYLTGGCRGV